MIKDLKVKDSSIAQVVRIGGRVVIGEDKPVKKSAPLKKVAPIAPVDEDENNADQS